MHSLIVARARERICELATSYGYSTLFLADAARQIGAQLVTMELADYNQAYACAQLQRAGLADHVDFRCGNALDLLKRTTAPGISCCSISGTTVTFPCFEAVYPSLLEEAVACTDNVIYPEGARPSARALREAINAKGDLQTVPLPIRQWIDLRWSAGNSSL